MTEKLLSTKKNGMAVLLLTILWVLASIAALIFADEEPRISEK